MIYKIKRKKIILFRFKHLKKQKQSMKTSNKKKKNKKNSTNPQIKIQDRHWF